MKLKRGLSVLLILLCGVVLLGCSNSKTKPGIEHLTPYYLGHLTPYAFTYTDTDTGEIQTLKMENDDYSFVEFGRDFKTMRMVFVTGKDAELVFVVTKCSHNKKTGNIKGNISRIQDTGPDKGRIIRYSFWSNEDTIYMKALMTHRVLTATRTPESDSEAHRVVEVSRNEVVARFYRSAPAWIGGGL